MQLNVGRHVLEANDRLAAENQEIFKQNGILVINLMSSPGAGKTSLLEKTIDLLKNRIRIGVIEGDIQSARDAERVAKHGVPAVQIETDGACHLDASMVRASAQALDLKALDLLVVENVGNLVCPAEFYVGEELRVMILSVTEGDDKPMKYPLMFRESQALLINKIDLLPYIDCSVEKIRTEARQLNPKQTIFEISCRTGQGLDEWCAWLEKQVALAHP
ncbi:MAG: hydrogenase nickel incorporation protein HypB [Deltaproteobacteria bacterium]|nr:hydrogenase nickel incorporation protein HypB [Deltaproteobacteria bacterium]